MRHWKQIVQNYIIRHADQIRKVTEPLRHHFGIEYFTYHRIDHAGHYTVLVDRPDWAEHYVSEKIFAQDPYLRHPDAYQSGICLIEDHGPATYKETIMKQAKSVLNVDLCALLIQKKLDAVEFFGFAGNRSLRSLYANHPNLLKSFARHFKDKLGQILARMQEEQFSLLEMKGDDFLCQDPICPEIDFTAQFAYLAALGIGIEKLSPRELQCLQFLREGKSAKQTASILGLSRRTIESYFESIKAKLGSADKRQIAELLGTP